MLLLGLQARRGSRCVIARARSPLGNSDPRGAIISLHFISEFTRPPFAAHCAASRIIAAIRVRPLSYLWLRTGLTDSRPSRLLGERVQEKKKSLHGWRRSRLGKPDPVFRLVSTTSGLLKIHLLEFRVFSGIVLGNVSPHIGTVEYKIFRKIRRGIAELFLLLQSEAKLVRRD